MNVIFSDVERNEYERLGIKLDKLVNDLKWLGLPHFRGFFNNWKEKVKQNLMI